MRILIPTQDKKTVSEVFGRCRFFAQLDDTANSMEFHDNPGHAFAHGAGLQAASFVVNQRADVLLTYDLGPKAQEVFKGQPLSIFHVSKEVSLKEALELFRSGKLSKKL